MRNALTIIILPVFAAWINFADAGVWDNAGLLSTETPINAQYVVNVDDYTGTDDQKVQAALSQAQSYSLSGQTTIIRFTGRTYLLENPIIIEQPYNNIVLQGEGSNTTTLKFTCNDVTKTCITIGTESETLITTLANDLNQNSLTFTANDLSSINPNEWFRLSSRLHPVYDSWAEGSVGQITRLESKNGNIGTMFDPASKYPKYDITNIIDIYKISPIKNIGIENLKIWRNDSGYDETGGYNGNNINLINAVNCWIKGVYFYQTCRKHVLISKCSHLEISGCYFQDARHFGHEGGGYAYGVQLESSSSNCLIENNIFDKLRHAMLVQSGANANVFICNYSYKQYMEYNNVWVPTCGVDIISQIIGLPAYPVGDICLHGNFPYSNLFEHNWSCIIVADGYHGANGTDNIFFRNITYDDDRNESHHIYLIDCPDFQVGSCMCLTDKATLIEANGDKGSNWVEWFGYYNGSSSMYSHTLFYNGTYNTSGAYFPTESLFYDSKPSFI